jgi:hypothetical protein
MLISAGVVDRFQAVTVSIYERQSRGLHQETICHAIPWHPNNTPPPAMVGRAACGDMEAMSLVIGLDYPCLRTLITECSLCQVQHFHFQFIQFTIEHVCLLQF